MSGTKTCKRGWNLAMDQESQSTVPWKPFTLRFTLDDRCQNFYFFFWHHQNRVLSDFILWCFQSKNLNLHDFSLLFFFHKIPKNRRIFQTSWQIFLSHFWLLIHPWNLLVLAGLYQLKTFWKGGSRIPVSPFPEPAPKFQKVRRKNSRARLEN